MTSRDLLKILIKEGWIIQRQTGSHIQLKHPAKPGLVTLPQHRGDIPPGTLASIKRQAGL
jgi:predicted RNA binding protein YcfA (HicA-like mRNA interferase family)